MKFYSVPTNHNCLCIYSESVPQSHATVTNNNNLMHMWHHVTNHLIISNDKDSNSETNKNYVSVTLDSVVMTTRAESMISYGLIAEVVLGC
jgi:hypothetical protein